MLFFNDECGESLTEYLSLTLLLYKLLQVSILVHQTSITLIKLLLFILNFNFTSTVSEMSIQCILNLDTLYTFEIMELGKDDKTL